MKCQHTYQKAHWSIPVSILRSIYQSYANSPSIPLALLSVSTPRHSPATSLAHASPAVRQRGDSTPQSSVHDSWYFKASSTLSHDHLYDTLNASVRIMNQPHRSGQSGPLDYSSSPKVKYVEGSTSRSTSPSTLPGFAVSRSGSISY